VDQELIAYLDRRFAELQSGLRAEIASSAAGIKSELRAEIASSAAGVKSELRAEIAAVAESANGIKAELRAEIAAVVESTNGIKAELRAEIASSAAETRRHFDVVADRLMDKIQLVGEGVIGVDQKLDRFRGEVADEFRRVDQRLLRLEARIIR
jgi:ethanolamine ammonia-lyase large subunit